MTRIGNLRKVKAVGAISTMFSLDDEAKFGLRAVEGRPLDSVSSGPNDVGNHQRRLFQALGIPLLKAVSSTMQIQRTPLPWSSSTKHGTPILARNRSDRKGNQRVRCRDNDDWVRVIGVVKDMHTSGLERSPIAQIYETQAQALEGTEASSCIQTRVSKIFAMRSALWIVPLSSPT